MPEPELPIEHPFEPYRIKMVERIQLTTRAERDRWLEEVGYNLFLMPAERVMIDLLTDSGTGAMSDRQWASMLLGDEAYANARSFYRLESVVRELTGIEHVIPAHQGRSAEHLLFSALVTPDSVIPSNHHFGTTRSNIHHFGGRAVDLGIADLDDVTGQGPFRGNVDLARLEALIAGSGAARIPFAMATVTDQEIGGQPISIENLRAVRALLDPHAIPLYLDVARFAENAFFVKRRETSWSERSLREIARAIFDCSAGFVMSAKKDAIVNIGGVIATRDAAVADRVKQRMVLTEGFPTYGGLAGRDLEAIATGLEEGLDKHYVGHRVGQVEYLAARLRGLGVPLIEPPGGHAVFVLAARFIDHLPPEADAGQTLVAELYRELGVRSQVVGALRRDEAHRGTVTAAPEPVVRLCVPWRAYTQSHLDAVAAAFVRIADRKATITGLRALPRRPGFATTAQRWEPIR